MKLVSLLQNIGRLLDERRMGRDFVHHSHQLFPNHPTQRDERSVVLVETGFWMFPNYIGVLYLIRALINRSGGVVVGYEVPPTLTRTRASNGDTCLGRPSLRTRIANWLAGRSAVWKALGLTSRYEICISDSQLAEAADIYQEWVLRIGSLEDIEDLSIHGIHLGDLIYDDFLTIHLKTHIDWTSPEFHQHLLEFAQLYVAFTHFLKENSVTAVVVSQSVYRNALPTRIAFSLGIEVFLADHEVVYRLTENRPLRDLQFKDYRQRFSALDESERRMAINSARSELERRWQGKSMKGLHYVEETPFGAIRSEPVLRSNDRLKVLIAPHDFFDSPHCYGKHLFPDFSQWLEFLGTASKQTEYDWYLKTHTNLPAYSQAIIDEYCRDHPWIHPIESSVSHRQLVDEGIDVVFTLYGTIASEYAAIGKLAISASENNPHAPYGFCLNPTTREQLSDWIRCLPALVDNWSPDEEEVLQYFFMAHLDCERSWLFGDATHYLEALEGELHQPAIYGLWAKTWSATDHEQARTRIEQFVRSKDYMLIRRVEHSFAQ